MTDKAKAFVDGLSLHYMATFVPQSQSRNAGEPPCLNWRVAIGPIITDYSQGVGHLPNYQHGNRLAWYHNAVREACECGKWFSGKTPDYYRSDVRHFGKKIPAPELTDVLYCLVSDASVLDYACFEDWASEYGIDPDSRSGEKTYRDCLAIALQLRQVLDLDAAREAFEDY